MKKSPNPEENPLKRYAYIAGVGMSLTLEMAIAGFVGWAVGSWADAKWGTKPWGAVVGLILLVSGSLAHIVFVLGRLDPGPKDNP